MTTAAKYGAQDLNGNPVNYQQLVNPANTGPSNVIVNTTFVNRTGTANKARLALSSTALVPQTVSSTQGLYPITANQTNNAASVETQQILTIGSTSSVTNAFTTAPITVTATTVGTNQIVCSSTVTLSVGQPVVFTSPIGGLQANINYYVLNIVSNTNFTVSNVWNGAIISLNGQTTNVLMYQSTANLAVGMPIQFHGTPFGNVVYNYNYYINTITSNNSFTVSIVAGSGTAVTLTTNALGTFAPFTAVPLTGTSFNPTINNPAALNVSNVVSATYNGIQGLSIGYANSSGNILSTAAININAIVAQNVASTPYNPVFIVCSSTLTLTTGMPIVFSATSGSITGGVVYYVSQIFSSIAFNISATPGGPVLPLSSTTPTGLTAQQATTFLQVGQPIVFNGSGTYGAGVANQAGVGGQVFGNLNVNTPYYVLTIPSATTFTVATTPGGSAVTLFTDGMNGTIITAGNFKIGQQYVIVSSGSTTFPGAGNNNQGTVFTATGPGSGTGTAMVCSSYVSGSGLVAGVTYAIGWLNTITAANIDTAAATAKSGSNVVVQGVSYSAIGTFSYANPTGSAAANTQAVSYFVSATTTSNAGVFIPINPMITTNAAHVSNPLTIASSSAVTNAFTVAAIAVSATTASTGYITCASTATLAIGQPVVFDTSFSTIVAGTVYYVLTVQSSTTFQISATQITSTIPSNSLYPLTTTTGQTVNMYQATTNLQVNVPMIFTGTAIGGVTAGQVYYVQNLLTTTVGGAVIPNSFQISTIYGGPALTLTTASGSMVATITPIVPTINVNASTASGSLTVGGTLGTYTNYLTTQYATCSATAGAAPYEITVNTTSWMSVGQPVVFSSVNTGTNVFASASIGSTNITAGTTYYVATIDSLTAFQVSATYGGAPVALGSTSQTMYVYQSTANLNVGQPVVFTGGTITDSALALNTTYYVNSVLGPAYFTVASTIYGSNLALTGGGTNINSVQIGPRPLMTISATVTSSGVTMMTFPVSATQQYTNLITINTTYPLSVGMPVVFSAATGLMAANQLFYVASIVNGTQFTVSSTKGGPVYVQNTTTGISANLYQSTTNLYLNQPLVFFPTAASATISNASSIPTGLTNMVYGYTVYINTFNSLISFTISLTPNSSLPGATATTSISLSSAGTTNAFAFLPMTNNVASNFAYQSAPVAVTATSATAPYLITCASTAGFALGQPVQFDIAIGGLAVNTTYYVLTTPSSTTFNVSTTPFGGVVVLTSATGSTGNVYQSTAGLTVGSAIQFTTASSYLGLPTDTYKTVIGAAYNSLSAGLTFYIQSIPSFNTVILTLINASPASFGAATGYSSGASIGGYGGIGMLPLGVGAFTGATLYNGVSGLTVTGAATPGAQSGAMYLNTISPTPPLVIGSTTATSNYFTTQTVNVTAVTSVGNLITCATTQYFYPGMSVVFSSGLGTGIVSGTVYYILTIPSATTFTVSSTFNGTVQTQSTTTGNITVQQTALFLQVNQPVVFYGKIAANPIVGVSLVSVSSGGVLTLGTAVTLAAGSTITTSSSLTVGATGLIAGQTYYVTTSVTASTTVTLSLTLGGSAISITGGSPTGTLTVSIIGLVNALPGVTYYVNEVINTTSFTVSQYINGSIFALLSATATQFNAVTGPYRQYNISATLAATTPSFTLAAFGLIGTQSTNGTNLAIVNNTFAMYQGMPISICGTSGVLVANTLYYVVSIYDQHRVVVSIAPPSQYASPNSVGYIPTTNSIIYQTPNGTALPVTTQIGTQPLYQSAAKLQLNQPVMFYGNLGGMTVASNALVIGRTYTVVSVGDATFTSYGAAANTVGTVFIATTTGGGTTGVAYSSFLSTSAVLLPNTVYYVSSVSGAGIGSNQVAVSATPTYAGTNITSYITSVSIASPGVFSTSNLPFTLVAGQAITITGTAAATLATGSTTPNRTYYVTNISGSTFSLETFPGNGGIQNTTSTSVSGWTFVLNGINPNIAVNLSSAGPAALGLAAQVASTAQAMTMVPLMSNVTAPNVFQAQPLPIVATSGSSAYSFTTGVMTVAYATSIGSNLITCLSTAGLTVGMPVSFSATLGNITSATTYYVLTVNSATTFTVATTWGGQVLVLTNAYNYSYVNASTANLTAGQPMVFTGSVFGGIIAYNTYYVATVLSTTTFTLANSLAAAIGIGGSPTLAQNTAATGYMLAYAATGSTTTTGAVIGGQNLGAMGTGNYGLVIGQQYMITSVGSTTWTTYGAATSTVGTIFTATAQGAAYGGSGTYNIGSTSGAATGTAIELVGLMGNMNASIGANAPAMFAGPTITVTGINGTQLYTPGNTNYLSVGQAVVFTGYTFISGITAGLTYYIQSVVSSNVFTLSATSNGAALTFTTGSNILSMQILNSIGTSLIPYQTYYTQSVPNPIAWSISSTNVQAPAITVSATASGTAITTGAYTVTAVSATGNLITTTSTAGLIVGQPIVFPTSVLGNIVATTIYYVQTVYSATQFSIATSATAQAFNPGTATGSVTMQIATANLAVGQQVNFSGNVGASGIVVGTNYYIQSLNANGYQFTVASSVGGSALSWTAATLTNGLTASFVINATALTTSQTATVSYQSNILTLATGSSTQYLLPNQPVVFTNTSGANWSGLNTLLTVASATVPAVSSAYVVTTVTTSTNVITINYVTSNTGTKTATTLITGAFPALTLNQPVVFIGTNVDNLVVNQTYYIQSITAATGITVSTTPGGAAVSIGSTTSPTAGTMLMIPAYYVKAVTGSNTLQVSATPGGAAVYIPTFYAQGNNVVQMTPMPLNTDFIYGDVAVAAQSQVTANGILVPPNTYLYASAGLTVFGSGTGGSATGMNAIAIGVQDLV